jgi:deazaflavin-dependent oxidoreductase (nitroreductase family)
MSSGQSRRVQPDWIADHMQRYLDTDGEDGHLFNGVPTLLLTTTGRKSGEKITTPLIYGESDGRYLLVASMGGAPKHPAWYLNLDADGSVGIQVMGNKFTAKARTANAEEKPALWEQMAKLFPNYTEYQGKTTREIPVVIIERE